MARADSIIAQCVGSQYAGGGTIYLIETPAGVLYQAYIDTGSDAVYRKSTDGGLTWSVPVVVFAGTVNNLSVFYDKWAGLATGKIRFFYTETGGNDTLYRDVDTASSDTLGTQTTVFAGTSAVQAGSSLSGCVSRGGYVYCRTCIDAGAEGGFFRSTDDGATWGARTDNEALATLDQIILLPGWETDNQDIQAIFFDVSANEITVQYYDDSANTWSESTAFTAVESNPASGFPHFAGTVDLTNSRNVVTFWNAVDTNGADLQGFVSPVAATGPTAFTTDVVANSTDDQGLSGITIDSAGDWIAYYCGKTDGTETYSTILNVYGKVSTDDGATWGAETQLTTFTQGIRGLYGIPIAYTLTGLNNPVSYLANNTPIEMKCNILIPSSGGGLNPFNGLIVSR